MPLASRLPSPFRYRDYRDYLRDVRAAAGRKRPVALAQWARQLGYRSRRSVGMVLEGKRLPSGAMKEKLGSWLKLSPREMRYFELLIEKRRRELQGGDPAEVDEALRRIHGGEYAQSVLAAEILPFISHWYHLVIKQLLSAPGARPDPEWLFARLRGKVSRARIRESIERLCRLGFFRWDEGTGRYQPLRGSVQTPRDIPSAAVRMHHRGMIGRALQALEEDPVDAREFTTVTLRARTADLEKMKKRIREFREAFDQEFETADSDEVFQLNVQLFRHT